MRKFLLLLLSLVLMTVSSGYANDSIVSDAGDATEHAIHRAADATMGVAADYPTPTQPAWTIRPQYFKVENVDNLRSYTIKGKVKRVLQWYQYTFVLSHEESYPATHGGRNNKPVQKAHIYRINQDNHTMIELSKSGVQAVDEKNYGDYADISDIGITADGYLLACNFIRTSHSGHYVGYYERNTELRNEEWLIAWDRRQGWSVNTTYADKLYWLGKDGETPQLSPSGKKTGGAWYDDIHGAAGKKSDGTYKYKNGVLRFYRWPAHVGSADNTMKSSKPVAWLKRRFGQNDMGWDNWQTGNFYFAEAGGTMAVSGNLKDCRVMFTCEHHTRSTFRLVELRVDASGTFPNNVYNSPRNPQNATYTSGGVKYLTQDSYNNREFNANPVTGAAERNVVKEVYFGMSTIDVDKSPFSTTKLGAAPLLTVAPYINRGAANPQENIEYNHAYYGKTTAPVMGYGRWVIDGAKSLPISLETKRAEHPKENRRASTCNGTPSTDVNYSRLMAATSGYGTAPNQSNFFKYGKVGSSATATDGTRILHVSSYVDSNGKVAGVKMNDVTNVTSSSSFTSPFNVEVVDGQLDAPVAATFSAATARVLGQDIIIHLFTDNKITTFRTVNVEQSRGIYAYNLRQEFNASNNEYTFYFTPNDDALSAQLIFYKGNTVAQTINLKTSNVKRGVEYAYTTACKNLPGNVGDELSWSVKLGGRTIYNWQPIYEEAGRSYGTAYHAVDKSPNSDYFGRIYVVDNKGVDDANNGVYLYNPIYGTVDNNLYKGGQTFGDPQRPTVDEYGKLYVTDNSTNHSGIWTMDPANPSAAFTQFFQGTRSNGIITNNGAEVGSAVRTAAIYGKGKDAKLYVFNVTQGSTLPNQSTVVYNIGQADGSMAATWDKAPSQILPPSTRMRNANTAMHATSHGFFLGQERGNGSNTTAAPSLALFSYAGAELMNSGTTYASQISNSGRGGFSISPDEKTLVLQDRSTANNVMIFDVTWNNHVPTLSKKGYVYPMDFHARQMTHDYAGNLVASGENGGFSVYAHPESGTTLNTAKTGINVNETRAQDKFRVMKCGLYDRIFVGGKAGNAEDDKQWGHRKNWIPQEVPMAHHSTRIDAECVVAKDFNHDCVETSKEKRDAVAGYIDIRKDGAYASTTLTVGPTGGLTVGGKDAVPGLVRNVPKDYQTAGETPDVRTDRELTQVTDLVVASGEAGQGALAHKDTKGETAATVQLYGRYISDPDGKYGPVSLTWQYMGTPFAYKEAADMFYGSWMYRWDETTGVWYLLSGRGHSLNTWQGYLLAQRYHTTYSMTGNILPSTSHTFSLTRQNPNNFPGSNYLANSWTAPLQISKLTTADFVNADATIYVYDPVARQYFTAPTSLAQYIGITTINPLQGFFVLAQQDNASLTLNYENLVAKDKQAVWDYSTFDKVPSAAPARRAQAAEVEAEEVEETIEMMRIRVASIDGGVDNLYLFQGEQFTPGFDNGADGRKLAGDNTVPFFAAASPAGEMAVLATPSYNGTMLTFRKGTASEYTLTFDYTNENDVYELEDLVTGQVVQIQTGNSYTFSATDAGKATRFRINHKTTGLDDLTSEKPSIWVEDGALYFENPTNEVVGVAVYTADGKLVEQLQTREGVSQLNVPSAGAYLIQVTTTNGTYTVKQLL